MLEVATKDNENQSVSCTSEAATVGLELCTEIELIDIPAKSLAGSSTNNTEESVVVPEKPPAAENLFNPEALYATWQEAVEDFRYREKESPSAGVTLNGAELDFETAFSFDDQLAETIEMPGTLVVAEHGMFQGDIKVTVALIKGIFKGKITASESVMVENHAVIVGEIDTPELIIRGGAIIEGRFHSKTQRAFIDNIKRERQLAEHRQALQNLIEQGERPARKAGFGKFWRQRIFS